MSGIQWYPGHMAKAKREITARIKMVDIVVNILDARIPKSSRNPDIEEVLRRKDMLFVLNKEDLADEVESGRWLEHLRAEGDRAFIANSVTGTGFAEVVNWMESLSAERQRSMRGKGIRPRALRVMVVGIPNSGKSSFINRLAGRSRARTGDRPGITRGEQWIRVGDSHSLELLDTPGLLWPKFDDERTGLNLAFTGAINIDILDEESLAERLLATIMDISPIGIGSLYGIDIDGGMTPGDIFASIGRARGCLKSGGEVDTGRAARLILGDFRKGRMGRYTLERVEELSGE